MRSESECWYRGTAEAIFQNINLIEQSNPHQVAIFGGDHIHRMNVASMMVKQAEVTVAAIPVPRQQASEFGVIEANEDGRIFPREEPRRTHHAGRFHWTPKAIRTLVSCLI